MRIAIAGVSHESSTFSLHRTVLEDFTVLRGQELWEALRLRAAVGEAVEAVAWVPILLATAVPGGPVDPAAFDAFVDEILEGLQADVQANGPLDGVYLFLHGAVNVLGRHGAEESLVRRVREVVGPETVLSASMDTHGNLSLELASLLDLAAVHRHAPHIDIPETEARAVRNLIAVIERGERPVRAHVRIPVLLPGERTSTVVEPGRSVFGALLPAIEQYGVLDVGLWVGFAWADEPRNSAAAFATGWDGTAVRACAEDLARRYWDAREDFVIVSEQSGTWDEALDFALAGQPAPLYVSDAGDNVSAGASGDVTYALEATLTRRDVTASDLRFLFTGFIDPASLEAAVAAGEGSALTRGIGAWTDARYAGPVERTWTVERLIEGAAGEGVVGALLTYGHISVIVQNHRAYFLKPDDPAFASMRLEGLAWVEPGDYDVVVVKNGYLFPGQASLAASWFMALTPGGTDLDFGRLRFESASRPMYPLDVDAQADLTATLLSSVR